MKKVIIFLVLVLTQQLQASEKYALIIAIGNYSSADKGWGDISSTNDITLIKNSLLMNGFKNENIQILKDQQATFQNIKQALNSFALKLKEDDIAVIHYSGHGQLIWDTNNDEVDGYDEAWVPIDAHSNFKKGIYEGQYHLRDDQLGDYFTLMRNRLGRNGQLLLVMDSCHSGTITRGTPDNVIRGNSRPFQPKGYNPLKDAEEHNSIIDRIDIHENAAPLILITASKADELNYEYQGQGSLSYAFSEAILNLPKNCSYRQLFAQIAVKMNIIAPTQSPTLEGNNLDLKLFKNEYINQRSFFEVGEIINETNLILKGGKLQYLTENTTLFLCKAGTLQPSKDNILSRGKITESKFNESKAVFNKPIEDTNPKNLWVFVDQSSYNNRTLKVYFTPEVIDESLKNSVVEFLESENIGEIVTNTLKANLKVGFVNNNHYIIYTTGANKLLEKIYLGTDALDKLKNSLVVYARALFLKKLNLTNQDYSFSFKLLPVEFDTIKKLPDRLLNEKSIQNENGITRVIPKKDYVILQVTNTGKKPIYFSILEINSKGKISSFMPNPSYPLTDDERKLLPGQTKKFLEYAYGFGPPYETLMLKGFSSNKPLDLSVTISEAVSRGPKNPLEILLHNNYNLNRGSYAEVSELKIDGYSYEILYEIIAHD
jgi:hypothetical protein